MKKSDLIVCPQCGHNFPIEEAILDNMRQEMMQKFEKEKNDAMLKAANDARIDEQKKHLAVREKEQKETTKQIIGLKNEAAEQAKIILSLQKFELDYQSLTKEHTDLKSDLEREKLKASMEGEQKAASEYEKKRQEDKELYEQKIERENEKHQKEINEIKTKANE
jgi:hypothetical protein